MFEDFYGHYGIDQPGLASDWTDSSTYWLRAITEHVGDVVWYELSLAPSVTGRLETRAGAGVTFVRSSFVHRALWKTFYDRSFSWRLKRVEPLYSRLASYSAPLSRDLIGALRRDRPDALFVQDYAAGKFDVLVGLAASLKIPVIAWHAGSRPDWYHGKWVKKRTIKRAHRVITSSAAERSMLIDSYGVDPARAKVILTPIDTDEFVPRDKSEAKVAADLDPGRRYVLYVGRLDDRVKRVGALIAAFSEIAATNSDATLLLVGDGPDRAQLEQHAKHLGADCRFAGWVASRSTLANVCSAADVLVLPSLSEGFPAVVAEAMACGTPVIASDVGGVAELVTDGKSGWLIPPGDDGALGRALKAALERNPDEVATMSDAARAAAVENVSLQAVGPRLRECFPTARAHG